MKKVLQTLYLMGLSFLMILLATGTSFAEGEGQSLAEISPDDPSLKTICVVAVILGLFAGYKMKNKK